VLRLSNLTSLLCCLQFAVCSLLLAVLGYSELFQRVVPIELRSFPSSTLLSRLFTSSSCPSGLKELYSDLLDSPDGTAKSAVSGCSSPMSTTNSSAGVEMMKVRVLSHVVGGITTSVRVSVQHVRNTAAAYASSAACLCPTRALLGTSSPAST
jgi:hypothetical protein